MPIKKMRTRRKQPVDLSEPVPRKKLTAAMVEKEWLDQLTRMHKLMQDDIEFTSARLALHTVAKAASPEVILKMAKGQFRKAYKGNTFAFNAIMDRIAGKPKQAIDMNVTASVRPNMDAVRKALLDPNQRHHLDALGEFVDAESSDNGKPPDARALPVAEAPSGVRECDPGKLPDAGQPNDRDDATPPREIDRGVPLDSGVVSQPVPA